MALTINQKPLAEVAASLSSKTPIGSVLNSAEWENVPAALRESAFFSARVESARALADAQAGLQKILTLSRDANGAISMDRGKFIAEMQKTANALGLRNADPNKRGGLEDFGSERRLKLIFEQQIGQAQSKAYYLSGQDPDILDAWPAQELVRLRQPKGGESAKRNWLGRWADAGGALYGGRMIALKTDPIWLRLSRFDRPYPPFDYSSGMGLEEIDRETAEALGLIKPGDTITPSVERDAEEIRASVKGLPADMRAALKAAFGKQITLKGDQVRWTGSTPPPPKPKPPAPPPVPPVTPPAPVAPPAAVLPPVGTPTAPTLQPAGPAVSGAAQMKFSTKKETARHKKTLEVIDAIHGDGALQPIPFSNKIARHSAGTYYSNSLGAVSIGTKKAFNGAEFALAHEVGHWLDHVGIPSPGKWASGSAPELQPFRDAVTASAGYQQMLKACRPKDLAYYASWEETFARAYSQFIATKSGDATMLSGLETFKQGMPPGAQWDEADFAPIQQTLQDLFEKMGWMK